MSVEAGAVRIGRLVRSADFERVLGNRSRLQSVHFALHHVSGTPSVPAKPATKPVAPELSTGEPPGLVRSVDDIRANDSESTSPTLRRAAIPRLWLGVVVPKRHARRAVTRTLLKRQIKAAVAARAEAMAEGLWVVRLRAGFDRAAFPSAASDALRVAARVELDQLLERSTTAPAARPEARPSGS